MGDGETAKKLNKNIMAQSDAIQAFCDENGLRRDYSREFVSEQLIKKRDVANLGNNGIIKSKGYLRWKKYVHVHTPMA